MSRALGKILERSLGEAIALTIPYPRLGALVPAGWEAGLRRPKSMP